MKCNIENKNIAWSDLDSLINHYRFLKHPPEEGETFTLADGTVYVYTKENNFSEVKVNGSGDLNINLYDLNKSAVAQLPALTSEEIHIKCDEFTKAIHEEYKDRYYMLYGKEIGYFTLFHMNDVHKNYLNITYEPIGVELEECLTNLSSNIKSIDYNDDGTALEIWLEYNGDITCMYFFPYDSGVIQTREVYSY